MGAVSCEGPVCEKTSPPAAHAAGGAAGAASNGHVAAELTNCAPLLKAIAQILDAAHEEPECTPKAADHLNSAHDGCQRLKWKTHS